MDISLIEIKEGINIQPESIHGMLWLQTHFKSDHWESLSNDQVIIPFQDAQMLYEDAIAAELNVNIINALSKSDKF